MKRKMRLLKQLLSAILCLVLVLTCLPDFTPKASAASDYVHDMGNGFILTIHDGQVLHTFENPDRYHDVARIETIANHYSRSLGAYMLEWHLFYFCDHPDYDREIYSGVQVKLPKDTSGFRCDQDFTYSGESLYSSCCYTYTISRKATAHKTTATTTPANCTSPAVTTYTQCEDCRVMIDPVTTGSKDPNNHVSMSNWKSNGDGTHTRTCSGCGASETGNCTGSAPATCLSGSVCATCGGACDPQLSHEYVYTVSGNKLIETCPNGCNHTATATLTIPQESYSYTGSCIMPADLKYEGDWKGTDATGFKYYNNEDVGIATVTSDPAGKTISTTFEIKLADIATATVTLDSTSVTYTGGEQRPTVSVVWNGMNLVEGTHYTLSFADNVNASDATTPAVAVIDGKNNFTGRIEAMFEIGKAALSDVSVAQNGILTYNGHPQAPDVTETATAVNDQPVTFTYSTVIDGEYGNMPTFENAGSYTVYYKATAPNHGSVGGSFTVTVKKQVVDLTDVKWNYTGAFSYDGKPHGVSVDESTLPEGAFVSSYTGQTGTDAASYQAAAAIIYDDNHEGNGTLLLDWEIQNNWVPTEYTASVPNGEGWVNEDFVITADSGYKISLTNTADGVWEDALTQSAETADGSVTFYLKKESDGTISLAKTLTYKLDKTPATGQVSFVGKNTWDSFVSTITFLQYYQDAVTIQIESADDLSGVSKVEYASSDKAMTLEEVKSIADWTAYTGSFDVALENAKKFVYFIRITDKAGNETYLSTDGAEYDTTAPVISSAENGKTYYTTQKVTVTDQNIATITLNGASAAEAITLDGDQEATYTIVATDKAGNATTVTVTMKPIKELAKATENLSNDNVTSEDAPALKELVEKLDELIADPDTSDDGERETLEQHKIIAESLLQTIEDAAKATDTENTEKVKDITAENVTPEDKTDLEKAKADLEKALEDNGGNYTEEEEKAIEDALTQIAEALETLHKVEAVEAQIRQLPENITKEDEAAITAADEAYNALSAYEKSLLDETAKTVLANAKADLEVLNHPTHVTPPNTGDPNALWLWFVLLLVSSAGIYGVTLVDRKKKAADRR